MPNSEDTLSGMLDGLFRDSIGDPSVILKILDAEERRQLEEKLGDLKRNRDVQAEDLKVKLETLTVLLTMLNNNQKLRRSIVEAKEKGRELIIKIYGLAYELNKIAFLEASSDDPKRMDYLLQAVLNGFLADRHSEVSPLVQKYISEFKAAEMTDSISVDELGRNLKYLLLLTVKVIRSDYDRKALLDQAEVFSKNFDTLQNSALDELDGRPFLAYRIAALGNIVYLHKNVMDYLFSGETKDKTNIYSLIDSYSFNAISLLKRDEDSSYEQLTYLVKYFFEQLCRNSVWNIADRSPAINEFFQKCIASTNNILYTLLPPQRDRILDLLTVKKSVVVNMPTSAGKSLLAELSILFTLHNSADEQNPPTVCYVVPTNALINQVRLRLSRNFEGLEYEVDGVLPFFEVDPIEEEILTRRHIDVLVSTPEKLDALIRRDHESIKNLKLVVVDEAHNINDESRGAKIELLLSTIKTRKAEARFLLMSPFIDNSDDIARWLGDTEQDSLAISYEWTPTKQYIGSSQIKHKDRELSVMYFPSARDHLIEEPFEMDIVKSEFKIQELTGSSNATTASILQLVNRYSRVGNILIICRGTGTSENVAYSIVSYFKDHGLVDQSLQDEQRINDVIALAQLELGENSILAECLKYGVAFHHSQLPSTLKEELEGLLREGLIKVVCSTTTLAQGMNFPITTVLFADLIVGGGRNIRELDDQLFWNIAGRAGRAYMDTEGHIILLQKSSGKPKAIQNKTKKYIQKDLQKITSTLTNFFEHLDSTTVIDKDLIKNNIAISNFLQYLNHIIRVSYNYEFDAIDLVKIRSMLSNSLAFQEIEFTEGFMEAQQQALGFTRRYIDRLKTKQTGQLTLADLFGISDISLSRVYGLIEGLREELAQEYGSDFTETAIKASNLILNTKSNKDLSRVVKILSAIPELQVYMDGKGKLNTESIARVIIGWVNGENVRDIATAIKYPDQNINEVMGMCHKYINGRLKTFIPWGMSIYQKLTNDDSSDDAKNLPSYIYFGVRDRNSVILSAAGIPRYALDGVKEAYTKQFGELNLDARKLDDIRRNLKVMDYSSVVIENVSNDALQRLVKKNL